MPQQYVHPAVKMEGFVFIPTHVSALENTLDLLVKHVHVSSN